MWTVQLIAQSAPEFSSGSGEVEIIWAVLLPEFLKFPRSAGFMASGRSTWWTRARIVSFKAPKLFESCWCCCCCRDPRRAEKDRLLLFWLLLLLLLRLLLLLYLLLLFWSKTSTEEFDFESFSSKISLSSSPSPFQTAVALGRVDFDLRGIFDEVEEEDEDETTTCPAFCFCDPW